MNQGSRGTGNRRNVVCGIVGCGVIGPVHADAFSRCDGVSVKWVCDIIEDRARGMAERFNVPRHCKDLRQILDDPEVDCVSPELTGGMQQRIRECEEEAVSGVGKSYYGSHHPSQIADFVDAVRAGRAPSVSGADARHCVDIVLAVYESQRTGRIVRLKKEGGICVS